MKISYDWLKSFVDFDLSPDALRAKLTMAGLAVDAVEAYGDDYILEFDLTSNRPDCLSHLGIAREAAAISAKHLKLPEIKLSESKTGTGEVTSVEIQNPELCPRYTARVIRGVRIGPSPDWLVKRLEGMGQRSVNNVADITNYVMLEMGQPLHAFDLEQLNGRRIIVRTAIAGEKMTTLDGEERELTPEMLVIADASRAVALAGIKGGEDSGITASTTNILLEAAYFAPEQVRMTSKALGLTTEASYRFERGTDPEIVPVASDRATAMIAEIAGGEVLRGIVDIYPLKSQRSPIRFRASRYRALTGLQTTIIEAGRILRDLGFTVEDQEGSGKTCDCHAPVPQDSLTAVAPSWRVDVRIEEDLIEEVARIAGYEEVKNSLPGSVGSGAYLPGEEWRRATRHALTALGYHEAISFSFVNAEDDAMLSDLSDDSRLILQNPIDETQAGMRTTLLGGLLRAVQHNFNYGNRNLRLFEIGKCFIRSGDERPREVENLALVVTGARNEADWLAASAEVDFYDLKGALETVFDSLRLHDVEVVSAENIRYLHPGRTAIISVGGREAGKIGQLHPDIDVRYKFKQPVFVAELDFALMLGFKRNDTRYRPLPKFPSVVRDLALLLDTGVDFASLRRAIIGLNIKELVSVRLFDIYSGKGLPPDKHSMALSLCYCAADRTLTDEEVNSAHDRLIKMVKRDFGAEIR
jgi:phenylalanyl-tRNA synthetase beta chain